jgi:hypothetical protein
MVYVVTNLIYFVVVIMYEEKKMPLSGFKSVTVPEEAYCKAKQLTNLGLEKSIGQAFENAIKEYMQKRQGLIKDLCQVKEKWNGKNEM